MNHFRVVHQGFDKLDVAFTGGFSTDIFPFLTAQKENAQRENRPQLVELGPELRPVHIFDRGMRGGYAFHLNNGPLGANFFVKETPNLNEWNLFSASLAEGLVAHGLVNYFETMVSDLRGMGAVVGKESINRVDYAVDFACKRFDLNPALFVCPPRSKCRVYYGDGQHSDELTPVIVTCGRRVESITIGRMPGRQLIVYNKRAEVMQRQKRFWFERWGIDPRTCDIEVWRAEVRAGKHELKDRDGLTTFSDIRDGIGDVLKSAIRDVRYLAETRTDTNVTRAALHPFWLSLSDALDHGLNQHQSGLAPGRIIEIQREELIDRCLRNVAGNSLSLASARGLTEEKALIELPGLVADMLRQHFESKPRAVGEKLRQVSARYRFLRD